MNGKPNPWTGCRQCDAAFYDREKKRYRCGEAKEDFSEKQRAIPNLSKKPLWCPRG